MGARHLNAWHGTEGLLGYNKYEQLESNLLISRLSDAPFLSLGTSAPRSM
jgi:hypothetical protein